MRFLIAMLLALTLVLGVSGTATAVSDGEDIGAVNERETAVAGTEYTCTDRTMTSKRYREWNWWTYRGQIWTNTMYYTKCESPFNYYYVIRSFRYMLDIDGSLNCSGGEITDYVMNGYPLGGTNPVTHDWSCVAGKDNYVKWNDVPNTRVGANAADKCFGFDWRIRILLHNDPEGSGPTRCLA